MTKFEVNLVVDNRDSDSRMNTNNNKGDTSMRQQFNL